MKAVNDPKEVLIRVSADTTDLDKVTEKAERLVDLLNEAMELANSIACTELNLRISTVIDDKPTEFACITS